MFHKLHLSAGCARVVVSFAVSMLFLTSAVAQRIPEPRREQLLNGLRILLVERPGESQAVLRLRIHSGAAFDLAGKEGTIALLSDSPFPDPNTREYVTDDLQGRLEVTTGYDSIDVYLSGRAEEFERLVEIIRNAVLSNQLSDEVFNRLRDARSKTVRELGVSSETIADRAISARLYGTYPYGRLTMGTPESLARIERSDVLLARERFLNPANATLVITGGIEHRRALRAVRQFLGAWRRADQIVPATFRQPEAVDMRTLVVDVPGTPDAQIRLAARGLSRSDKDLAAALVLAELARARWLSTAPELKGKPVHVRHNAYSLGGTFQMGASVPPSVAAAALDSARRVIESLSKTQPNATELESAKSAVVAELSKQSERPEREADVWLDEQSYGGASSTLPSLMRALALVTSADVQRVAARLFSTQVATVAVGEAATLKSEMARIGAVELFDPNAPKETVKPSTPSPLKSPTVRRP